MRDAFILGLAACLALVHTPAGALQSSRAGTSGAAFLQVEPGARPGGMGAAFAGVADDIHTLYFNPAGLGLLDEGQATGMHHAHFEGIRYGFAAVGVPVGWWRPQLRREHAREGGTLALGIYHLAATGIERRGVVETDAPAGLFTASDVAYSLGYGARVSSRVAVGAAIKLIDQTLDGANAKAFAVDAGALTRRGRLSIGVGFRNLGSSPRFRGASNPLPWLGYVAGGLALRPRWLMAADLRVPRDQPPGLSLGTECWQQFQGGLRGIARGGFNTSNLDAGGLAGLTLGAGLELGRLRLDFAWVPFGNLGDTYRYSLLVAF